MEPADEIAESVDMDANEPVEAAVIEGDADQEPEPAKAVAEEDEDWLFEGGLDIPELELTDPEQDEGARG
jgi:hypothetical protein